MLQHVWLLLSVFAVLASSSAGAVTIFFDGAPDEVAAGITPGATDFRFGGSTWTGGTVTLVHRTADAGEIFTFAYVIAPGAFGSVTFDVPAVDVTLSFRADVVTGGGVGFNSTALFAFDEDGRSVGSLRTRDFQILSEQLDVDALPLMYGPMGEIPISRISFGDAAVDNFSFTLVPEPASIALVGLSAAILFLLRPRYSSRPRRTALAGAPDRNPDERTYFRPGRCQAARCRGGPHRHESSSPSLRWPRWRERPRPRYP